MRPTIIRGKVLNIFDCWAELLCLSLADVKLVTQHRLGRVKPHLMLFTWQTSVIWVQWDAPHRTPNSDLWCYSLTRPPPSPNADTHILWRRSSKSFTMQHMHINSFYGFCLSRRGCAGVMGMGVGFWHAFRHAWIWAQKKLIRILLLKQSEAASCRVVHIVVFLVKTNSDIEYFHYFSSSPSPWNTKQCTFDLLKFLESSVCEYLACSLLRMFIWEDGSLEILNVTPQDEGRYTCFAENDWGKANSTRPLVVTGKLQPISNNA